MLTCFYDLQILLWSKFSRKEEEAKYDPLTRFTLIALASKKGKIT